MNDEELAWALQTYRDRMIANPDDYEPDSDEPDSEFGVKMAAELIALVDARED